MAFTFSKLSWVSLTETVFKLFSNLLVAKKNRVSSLQVFIKKHCEITIRQTDEILGADKLSRLQNLHKWWCFASSRIQSIWFMYACFSYDLTAFHCNFWNSEHIFDARLMRILKYILYTKFKCELDEVQCDFIHRNINFTLQNGSKYQYTIIRIWNMEL